MKSKGTLCGVRRSILVTAADVTAYITCLFLVTTGWLIHSSFPHGRGAGGAGRGMGGARPEIWGLTRHQWGDVHFWISVLFLAAIALHLLLHLNWIRVSLGGKGRWLAAGLGLATLLAFGVFLGPRT